MKDQVEPGKSSDSGGSVGDVSRNHVASQQLQSEQLPVPPTSADCGGNAPETNTLLPDSLSSSSSGLKTADSKSGKMEETQPAPSEATQNGSNEEVVPKTEMIPRKSSIIDNSYISKDDPLCEDIISCLSALDEVLNEFDDTSLPYTTDFETSCGDSLLPTSDEIAVTDCVFPVRVQHPPPSSVSHLVSVNDNSTVVLSEASSLMNGNKLVDQNQNLDWINSISGDQGVRNNNNGPVIHTSHLIQIPVAENSPHLGGQTFHEKQNSSQGHPNNNSNQNNKSSLHPSSQSPYSTRANKPSLEMNGNGYNGGKVKENEKRDARHQQQQPKKSVKGGAGMGTQQPTSTPSQPTAAGGTYSKGKSYEILIPKITSGSFSRDSSISSGKGTITTSSHSSRASIMVPVIESLPDSASQTGSAKTRSQLNVGLFQPANASQGTHVMMQKDASHTTHVPVSSTEMGNGNKLVDESGAVYENQQIGERNPHREPDKDHHQRQQHQPSNSKLTKVGGDNNGGVSSTYITVSEGKSSLGQSSSSGVSSAMAAMMKGDEEQWNFPSEKNLPRSLRKTRKTCFLDEGEAANAKMAKPVRSESPYCCSSSESTGICTIDHCTSSDQGNYASDVSQGGRNGNHKSPRVMPRRGIPSKCEIINKGDGNFALSECSPRQIWNGQQQQQQQPHTSIVATASCSSSPSNTKDIIGRGNRKKIYEDVVLSHTTAATPADQARSKRISAASGGQAQPGFPQQQQQLQHHSSSGVASSGSPSSTFTSSSGVSLSVTSNPTFVDEEGLPLRKNSDIPHLPLGPASKSRKAHHTQQQQPQQQQQTNQEQLAPKPRARQQVPAPGTEIPCPTNHFVATQNQFIPLVNGRPQQQTTHVTPMSSQHSPNSVEIGTDEEHHRGDLEQHDGFPDDDDSEQISSGNSPVKTSHNPAGMRKSSVDTEFEETASDSKILKMEEKSRRGKSHSKNAFDTPGQNGSLPNASQFQMMRVMMMMKSSAKNSSVASSSSRSSSSSGSVSVKSSSSSSDNNCGDVFHENIVQDYPTNIFTVAGANGSLEREKRDDNENSNRETGDPLAKPEQHASSARATVTSNGVVLRAKGGNGRANNGAAATGNQGSSTLEIDDGYLSMINRNEAPLLWPEEFIENETFSKAELKRLSVHLNDDDGDDTDVEDAEGSSNSHSVRHKANKNEKQVSQNKSGFAASHNRSSLSSSSNTSSSNNQQRRAGRREKGAGNKINNNNGVVVASTSGAGRSSTEKTDYFSDDSLEMEGEDELLLLQSGGSESANGNGGKLVNNSSTSDGVVRAATSFVIPFHTKGELQEESDCHSRNGKVSSHQIRKSNSQVSRIPKIVSPATSNNRRSSSGNINKKQQASPSGNTSPTSPIRKPCSFFIPFSDAQASNENNRKLSTGESTIIASSALVSSAAAGLRSTSLPSSRRNSADTRQQQNSQQAVLWSGGENEGKVREGQETKASNETYASDVNNKIKVASNTKQSETDPCLHQSVSSSLPNSSLSDNNQANLIPDNQTCNESNGDGNKEKGGRRVAPSEKLLIVDNGDNITNAANRSPEIKTNVLCTSITTTSNNDSTTNNAKGSKLASDKIGSGSKSGGSFSKRHKFEKQQTFIVTPSRDTTTLDGQRLEEFADSASSAQTQNRELTTTTDQIGLGRHSINTNHSNDLTHDDTGLNETTSIKHNDSKYQMQTDRHQIEHVEFSEKTKAMRKGSGGMPRTWEDKRTEGEGKQYSQEISADPKHVPISKSSAEFKKNMSELNNISSISVSSERSNNKGATSAEAENSFSRVQLKQRHVDGGSEKERQQITEGGCVGADEDNTLEGHESVSEELESVVKMFLKATEGLLDPEENSYTQGSENLKCTLPLGTSTNSTSDSDDQKGVVQGNSENVVLVDGSSSSGVVSELRDYDDRNASLNSRESQLTQEMMPDSHNMSSFTDVGTKQPLMTSTPIAGRSPPELKADGDTDSGVGPIDSSISSRDKRHSFLMLTDATNDDTVIEDLNEQPPDFIPEPPATVVEPNAPLRIVAPPHKNIVPDSVHPTHHHHSLDGKVALDLLSQRITRNCPSPVENMSVSQFLHNKKNIWAMYDRPYDEDVLPPSFPRGFASRSQENLIDAMSHERLTKSFSARGQSSTLPLNCRPPPVQRRTSTFRNMFNKFRKHKATDTVIPEGPEVRDEEAQSITSRETGPSEGKKRGFFSRLFRRSRKH